MARRRPLVGLDAIAIPRTLVERAHKAIAGATKIPAANVLVGCNHTHEGGPIVDIADEIASDEYGDQVVNAIAQAVTSAWNSLHPAELGIGSGRQEGIAFNRRFVMKDGREITHPGKPGTPHHADIVMPAGPVDPEVGVLAAHGPDGTILGVVVQFGCHGTVVGGDLFSPDYCAYLRKHLKTRYGEQTPVVFLLGPCGDITQVDNQSTSRNFGVEHADMMGRLLAGEAIRTINRMSWLKEVAGGRRHRDRPLRDPSRSRPRSREAAYGLGTRGRAVRQGPAQVAEERKKNPVLDCEVQGCASARSASSPTARSISASLGLHIKACSPLKPTWVIELANEYIGYVPTAQGICGGGYRPAPPAAASWHDRGAILEASLRAMGNVAAKA